MCDAPRNMFEEIDAEGKTIGAPVVEEPEVDKAVVADMAEKVKPSLFNNFFLAVVNQRKGCGLL